MAKHRNKKRVVYHNNKSDTWTNDAKDQLSLDPGSAGYKARQEKLAENSPSSDQNMDDVAEDQFEISEQREAEKEQLEMSDDFVDAFAKGEKSSSVMQYRGKMQISDAVAQTAKIASDGLDRNISSKEIAASVNDSHIREKDVAKVALKKYRNEAIARETPVEDVDHDGDIDQDDVDITPGMSKMMRYM